jgi:hypothetical protein
MSQTQQSPEKREKTGEAETTQSENRQPDVLIDTTSSYIDDEQKFE